MGSRPSWLHTYRVDDQIVSGLVGADDELCNGMQAFVGVFHKVVEGPHLQQQVEKSASDGGRGEGPGGRRYTMHGREHGYLR